MGLILTILDGVAAKQLADEWASATAESRFIALQNVLTNETMNPALASLFNFIFAGVTFILFGLAVALSDVYPRWLGWVVVAAGVVSIAASLVQGVPGEPSLLSWILTIIGPTVITLWILIIGVLMGRKASQMKSQRGATSLRSASFEYRSTTFRKEVRTLDQPTSPIRPRYSHGQEREDYESDPQEVPRFSRGLERIGPAHEKQHEGNFAVGQETNSHHPEWEDHGRFSRGQESEGQ
ncbi:MAG: DUF4386 family protein [Actinomycetota bacterium]